MPADFNPHAYTPLGTAWYYFTARVIMRTFYQLRHRVTITGRENLPQGSFVAVANHLSNADPPLLSYATDRPLAFLAKKELYRHKVLRMLILSYGAISVDREKPEVSTFKAVKHMFKAGWSLGMFIEGTRNKTPGILGQPHEGPAYFAKANKVPIVPIGILGTEKAGKKGYVHIGKPIEPSSDLDATTWKIMEAISELTGYALPERRETVKLDEA